MFLKIHQKRAILKSSKSAAFPKIWDSGFSKQFCRFFEFSTCFASDFETSFHFVHPKLSNRSRFGSTLSGIGRTLVKLSSQPNLRATCCAFFFFKKGLLRFLCQRKEDFFYKNKKIFFFIKNKKNKILIFFFLKKNNIFSYGKNTAMAVYDSHSWNALPVFSQIQLLSFSPIPPPSFLFFPFSRFFDFAPKFRKSRKVKKVLKSCFFKVPKKRAFYVL